MRFPHPKAYQILFFSLLIAMVGYFARADYPSLITLLDLVLVLAMVSTAMAAIHRPEHFLPTVLLMLAAIVSGVYLRLEQNAFLWPYHRLVIVVFLLYLMMMILRDVMLYQKRVNAQLLYGALIRVASLHRMTPHLSPGKPSTTAW